MPRVRQNPTKNQPRAVTQPPLALPPLLPLDDGTLSTPVTLVMIQALIPLGLRPSDQKLRWCASALWATERRFRRVKNHRHLPLLKHALQHTLSLTKLAAA